MIGKTETSVWFYTISVWQKKITNLPFWRKKVDPFGGIEFEYIVPLVFLPAFSFWPFPLIALSIQYYSLSQRPFTKEKERESKEIFWNLSFKIDSRNFWQENIESQGYWFARTGYVRNHWSKLGLKFMQLIIDGNNSQWRVWLYLNEHIPKRVKKQGTWNLTVSTRKV